MSLLLATSTGVTTQEIGSSMYSICFALPPRIPLLEIACVILACRAPFLRSPLFL